MATILRDILIDVASQRSSSRTSLGAIQKGHQLLPGERSSSTKLGEAHTAGNTPANCPANGIVRPMILWHIIEPAASLGTAETTTGTERPAQEGHHLIASKGSAHPKTVVPYPLSDPVLSSPLNCRFGYVTVGNILETGNGLRRDRTGHSPTPLPPSQTRPANPTSGTSLSPQPLAVFSDRIQSIVPQLHPSSADGGYVRRSGRCVRWGGHPPRCSCGSGGQHRSSPGNSPLSRPIRRFVSNWLKSRGRVVGVGVEGTGSYGAGLAGQLTSIDFEVVEVKPSQPPAPPPPRQNRHHRRRSRGLGGSQRTGHRDTQ